MIIIFFFLNQKLNLGGKYGALGRTTAVQKLLGIYRFIKVYVFLNINLSILNKLTWLLEQ
jgi:hypothetical protein